MKIEKSESVAISPVKKVEVIATAKHPAKTGSKRYVPEHMVDHLLKKGMIEDPSGSGKKSKKAEE